MGFFQFVSLLLGRLAPNFLRMDILRMETSRKPGSGKPKANNRVRKEVIEFEQRQYRQQILEAKTSEHKSWVGNDVCDLVDMRKRSQTNIKGRWAFTVNKR